MMALRNLSRKIGGGKTSYLIVNRNNYGISCVEALPLYARVITFRKVVA